MDLLILRNKLLKVSATSTFFSELLIESAVAEDSAWTSRSLFCLPESSFNNIYVLLEFPMKFFGPRKFLEVLFEHPNFFPILLNISYFSILCGFSFYCWYNKFLFEIRFLAVLVIHPGFISFDPLSFMGKKDRFLEKVQGNLLILPFASLLSFAVFLKVLQFAYQTLVLKGDTLWGFEYRKIS